MFEIFAKILTVFSLIAKSVIPNVLGDTANPTYPYTFISDNHLCNTESECYNYCVYTYNFGGTGNGWECQQLFPEIWNTSTITYTPIPTSTPITTTLGFPIYLSGEDYICYTNDTCYTKCQEVATDITSLDRAQCQDLYPALFTTVTATTAPVATTTTSSYTHWVSPNTSTITTDQTAELTMWQGYSGGSSWKVSPIWSLPNGGGTLTNKDMSVVFTPYHDISATKTITVNARYADQSLNATITVTIPSTTTYTATPVPTYSTTTTSTTTATPYNYTSNTTTSAYYVLKPEKTSIRYGSNMQFNLYKIYNNTQTLVSPSLVNWRVVNGGGSITTSGLFTAYTTSGIFNNTVRAEYLGVYYYASVEVSSSYTSTTSYATPQVTANNSALLAPYPTTVVNTAQTISTTPIPQITPQATPAKIFSYLNQRVDNCLRSNFSDQDYYRYFDPSGPHGNINDLGSRLEIVKKCIEQNRIPEIDQETKNCLIGQLGQERFVYLYGSGAEPTTNERNKISFCSNKPNIVDYQQEQQLDPIVLSCLQLKLGSDRFESIKNGSSKPNQDELILGRSCLNVETNIVKPPMVIQTPPEQIECLKNIVGSSRYQQIIEGKAKATEAEMAKAKACREDQDSQGLSARSFLPAPPEHIPFVPIAKEDINIAKVESQNTDDQSSLVLQGKTLPNATVDIYIFSEPIVVTTQADANGNWTYQLSYHLPSGNHEAYTIVQHPDKGAVRSEAFNFGVAYARADGRDTMEMMVAQPMKNNSINRYFILSLTIIIITLLAFFLFLNYKTKSKLIGVKNERSINLGTTILEQSLSQKQNIQDSKHTN